MSDVLLNTLINSQATAALTAVSGLLSWPMYLVNRKTPGALYWALANSLLPVSLYLLSTRSYAPMWLSTALASHLLLGYVLLLSYGTALFFSQKPPRNILLLIALFFSIPFLYFCFYSPSISARMILMSVALIICALMNMIFIWNRRERYFSVGVYFFYCILIFYISMLFARCVSLSVSELPPVEISSGLMITVFNVFSSFGMTLCFYMLCSERQIEYIKHLRAAAADEAESKSLFLSYMSHELRTPLNIIVGSAQLMAVNSADKDIKYKCSLIVDAGLALSRMANQVLLLSEKQNDTLKMDRANVEIEPWLQRLADTYLPMFLDKKISFELNIDTVKGRNYYLDEVKIRQVLTNLLDNALKFSAAGTVVLKVTETTEPNQLNKIEFHVSDQGRGIAEEELNHLLQPFRRAMNASNTEGFGLGLALSQKLLDSLNSELHVVTQLGVGSHFYFSIDAIAAENPVASIPQQNVRALTILLVEDIEVNRYVISEMLALDSHQVVCADSVQAAFNQVEQHHFELILLDMSLADGDGLELHKRLRLQYKLSIPTIVLTADVSFELREKCLNAGISDVLYKPLTLESLRQSLRVNAVQMDKIPLRRVVNFFTFNQIAVYLPEAVLKRRLSQLHSELGSYISAIELALSGEKKELKMMLHRLTSISATLGLEQLSDKSAEYEQNPYLLTNHHLTSLTNMAAYAVEQLKQEVNKRYD